MIPATPTYNNFSNDQHLSLNPFDASLHQWCEEKKGTAEYAQRITAVHRMQECKDQSNPILDLNGLGLTSLPEVINKLSHITTLDLAGNCLTTLPSLENLQQLANLDLSFNQFQSLPPEIGNLQHLTHLNLNSNQLKSLPPEIENLRHLTQLHLSNNQLKSLPPEIGNLRHLTSLALERNQLQSLPPEIGNLRHLTQLHLKDNQLQSLPPEIGNLRYLTQLHLSNNQLQSLPPEIGNLRYLTQLHLSGNQLQSLPPEIGNLRHLTWLELEHNQLQSLPPEIGNLRHLTKLELDCNQLQSLPQHIENLQNLTSLSLRQNLFTEVPPQIASLRNLERVLLSNNSINLFPSQIGHLQQTSYNPSLYLWHRQASPFYPPPPFRISKQQFDDHPEQILKQLADWPHLPQKIEFLDAAGNAFPGVDAGGLRKQFYTLLIENLLKTPLFSTYLQNGFPTCAEVAEEHNLHDLLVDTARVLSHMYNNNILTGRVFSDNLFALLHIVRTTENPEERTKKILELLQQPHLHAIAAWLAGDDSYQDEVRAAIEATWDKNEPLKDADLRREAEALLDNTIEPYVLIAKALLAGCSGQLAQDIQNVAPQEVSLRLQGAPLEAEKLIAAIRIAPPADTNPEVVQKVNWLKERIQQEADQGNTEWLERFLFCITSQKTLSNSARIEVVISINEHCKASTCFNQLQIPTAPSTKEEFFEKLDLLMADTGFSMA